MIKKLIAAYRVRFVTPRYKYKFVPKMDITDPELSLVCKLDGAPYLSAEDFATAPDEIKRHYVEETL